MFEKQLLTLVFVRKQAEVLLGLKKRGFGKGKWNGFGGKVEPSETIEQAAKRYTLNLKMKPQWYPITSVPFDKMWADDKLWFPLLLESKKFHGYFKFQGHETILDYQLKEVSSLESNL
ncbi:7,8-dihydro-8-oxoguanine triphosphatase-like [Limulus polyphemus]|uniref:Oxidized purine nucleoside triphosphate hydrolase n=1 Tax=Limulus polyphemus TaxID=6850 RepID=A0ABM1C103_LIMPO|nr:7,8-dihydro-8-oxoguanine triphosphatase-like [Limulus polyphemus]